MSAQRILITGSSSGFGYLTTKTLLDNGHTVFASMRDPTGKNAKKAAELTKLAGDTKGKLHIIKMDVTSDAEVIEAIDSAVSLEGGIDIVINNAGIGVGGLQEAYTIEQFQKVFDVNVYAVQRVNRAVLPAMREQGKGLLIHVSSTLGRMIMPFCGPYIASKFALEGLAESYRYELAPFGVDSVIVEPGGYGTNFFANVLAPGDDARTKSYGPMAEAPDKMWAGMGEMLSGDDAPDPQLVADAISKLVETPAGKRPLRTVVDGMGMGDGVVALNAASDEIETQVLGGFGMSDMLHVKGE